MKTDTTAVQSLTRRLRRSLLITLTTVLVLATLAAGITAYLQASDSQDETLLSVARLVETNQIVTIEGRRARHHGEPDDSAVQVWVFGDKPHAVPDLKKTRNSGFHTLLDGDDLWRVFITRANDQGQRFVVAQQLDVSTELAFSSALNTALPLLALFLVVPLLVAWIVKHSLRPLNQLAEKVEATDSLQPDFTDKEKIPSELIPFVSAIESLLAKNAAYNARQRRFIADAAHELRTPITALSLQLENWKSAGSENKKAGRLAALEKGLRRLQRLIGQLLDLARAQAAPDGEARSVSLNEQVRQEIAELFPLLEQKELSLDVARNEEVVVIDRNHQLQHLIRNALSNAIKYTPAGGSIVVEIYPDNTQGVLSVTDNGPGVDAQELANLSRPFYRSEEQTSGQGAGLGLAICYEIASRLHGRISLSNVTPSGFRFCYRQPLTSSR